MPTVPPTVVDDERIRDAVFELLDRRSADATICPSEVARSLAPGAAPDAWRALMPQVRAVAGRLAAEGRLLVTRRGAPVDATRGGGPIRLGRPGSGPGEPR